MTSFSLLPAEDSGDLASDVERLFRDINTRLGPRVQTISGEYHPPVDVLETQDAIRVIVDVSGVSPEGLRVMYRDGVLVVAGVKMPPPTPPNQTFHLVEREFGRFARAVRLTGAFDVPRSGAGLQHGELVVHMPRLVERRGAAHAIPITPLRDDEP